MSPCMGVPPVDYLYYSNNVGSDSGFTEQKRRRRHFSLEETCDDVLLDDSSSSNDSAVASKAFPNPGCNTDLNPIKSFINGKFGRFLIEFHVITDCFFLQTCHMDPRTTPR